MLRPTTHAAAPVLAAATLPAFPCPLSSCSSSRRSTCTRLCLRRWPQPPPCAAPPAPLQMQPTQHNIQESLVPRCEPGCPPRCTAWRHLCGMLPGRRRTSGGGTVSSSKAAPACSAAWCLRGCEGCGLQAAAARHVAAAAESEGRAPAATACMKGSRHAADVQPCMSSHPAPGSSLPACKASSSACKAWQRVELTGTEGAEEQDRRFWCWWAQNRG